MLQKGDRAFEATAKQQGMLSQWSGREPVTQLGTIRQVFPSGPDGALAYFADFSGGEGGSGGGTFRVVDGQLTLEAIVRVPVRPEMDGKPYNEELYQNQSGLVGEMDQEVLHPMLARNSCTAKIASPLIRQAPFTLEQLCPQSSCYAT